MLSPVHAFSILCREIGRANEEQECDGVINGGFLLEHDKREHGKSDKSYDLLDNLKLGQAQHRAANAVRRDLKAVLEKRDAPTGDDDHKQRLVLELEVPVPGGIHKSIGAYEKENGGNDFLHECCMRTIFL